LISRRSTEISEEEDIAYLAPHKPFSASNGLSLLGVQFISSLHLKPLAVPPFCPIR